MFKPMLAAKAEISDVRFPVYASPKLDGVRASVVGGRLLSRTLKPIPNARIRQLLEDSRFEGLDGELIVGDPTAHSVYRDTVSGVMKRDGAPDFTFYVFDDHNVPKLDFASRLHHVAQTLPNFRGVALHEHVLVKTAEELMRYEAAMLGFGYEGTILRSPDASYKFGRSTVKEGGMLKRKLFEDSEAEVLGVVEEMANNNVAETNELGRTKRSSHKENKVGKGRMGALHVRDVKTGIEFHIGTGFDVGDRERFFLAPPRFIKYKSFNIGVKEKPRHPVFLGVRDERDM